MKNRELLRPAAREGELVVQEVMEEILVYDLKRHQAHCLNRAAAFVWRHCDGRRSVPCLARLLGQELGAPVSEQVVWLALDQLDRRRLLEGRLARPAGTVRVSRRELMRKLGLAGAALPWVASIAAPKAAAAATPVYVDRACCRCASGLGFRYNPGWTPCSEIRYNCEANCRANNSTVSSFTCPC